jgi:hypothetical protein
LYKPPTLTFAIYTTGPIGAVTVNFFDDYKQQQKQVKKHKKHKESRKSLSTCAAIQHFGLHHDKPTNRYTSR